MEEETIKQIPIIHELKKSEGISPIAPLSPVAPEFKVHIDDDDLKSESTILFKRELAHDLRAKVKSIIEPNLINNLRRNLRSQIAWRRCGNVLEVLSKIILSLSAVPAFLASAFQDEAVVLSTISGILTTIGSMFFLLASKSQKESKERSIIATRLLRGAGLKYDVVDISEPAEEEKEKQ